MPQELFSEIASFLTTFEDKRNLAQASKQCYLRSGTLRPQNRRQWIRYLQSQCRDLATDSFLEVCEDCLEIVPYDGIRGRIQPYWLPQEVRHFEDHHGPDDLAWEGPLLTTIRGNLLKGNGICAAARVRWMDELWDEKACEVCYHERRMMLRSLCKKKRKCTKWQRGPGKKKLAVRLTGKVKATVGMMLGLMKLALGKQGL